MTDPREALVEVAYMQIATEKMLTITPTGPGRASVPPHWRAEAEERAKPWIDAILAAGWTPPGERVTDPRDVAHIECDCVPELGPPHCHLCSTRAGTEVPWAEAHPAPAPLPSVEGVAREFEYRLRTCAAYFYMRGKHREQGDEGWIERERDGGAERVLALLPGRTEAEAEAEARGYEAGYRRGYRDRRLEESFDPHQAETT